MKIVHHLLASLFTPIRKNGAFFVFMYVLGLVCFYSVIPANAKGLKIYGHAPAELFVDVYLLCVLLTILPEKIRKWVRRLFYFIAYTLAIIDVYCFVKFDCTITPTMLLLVGETDSREAGEFFLTYLTPDILWSRLTFVLLVLIVHIVYAVIYHRKSYPVKLHRAWKQWLWPLAGLTTLILFIISLNACLPNKQAFIRLMSYDKIGDVEHELTEKNRAFQYQPIYRLVFSVYANHLTSKQLVKLVEGIDKVEVDSCRFVSKNIVLIIGESYNRYHSQLYGYEKETTPLQLARAKKGELIPFTDVVAPWNLTSFVFKHLFSMYSVGDKGEWCDYPLFPELFRKAGYHVAFLTNQFLPKAKEEVYDFSGGFFLNNQELSNAMFDTRNSQLYYFDEGLLKDYDTLKTENKEHNLIIFHLKGQHTDYRTRCPKSKQFYKREDYDRPGFSARERLVMAFYDNATRYNDSIVNQIITRFEDEEAVIIYVPDHGEECYSGNVHFYGRMHSTEITARLAREEFDIPMWIYCSHRYMVEHPEIYSAIIRSKDKPYMTDALPHLLLYLAGIAAPSYRPEQNILGPEYDEHRPRILKNTTDYDKLKVKK
ncbi:MAG: sulfatase-like hydrolase/transferase [Prevotella sp.]|nr:sulfatase-like hydrolase/transferase [Prevotella sp.]